MEALLLIGLAVLVIGAASGVGRPQEPSYIVIQTVQPEARGMGCAPFAVAAIAVLVLLLVVGLPN